MNPFEYRESFETSNKNQKIFGIVHQPSATKNPPVVVICHGLGGHKTGRYRVYVDLAEELVKSNIAVIRFDFRGSGDSEGKLCDITIEDQISDVIAVLDYIKRNYPFDFKRLGFFGRSLGAAIAILAAAKVPEVKSLALWAAIYEGKEWQAQLESVQNGEIGEKDAIELRRINGQVASLEFYSQMLSMPINSALRRLDHVPLMLIHGEKDSIISINHALGYKEARKCAEGKTLLIKLPQGDHDFTYTDERQAAIIETSQWFKKTLEVQHE
ncbi:MAG: alpha/beta hydrolase [Parachlamydiaceae bacterium]